MKVIRIIVIRIIFVAGQLTIELISYADKISCFFLCLFSSNYLFDKKNMASTKIIIFSF
jgi:hypothetical protein